MLVCNVSQSWQVAHVHSHCEYSLEVADGIDADVSLYVGLKSINITLRGPHKLIPLYHWHHASMRMLATLALTLFSELHVLYSSVTQWRF